MVIAYCIKCGNKFPKDAVYCPYCGTKVYRPEEDPATPAQVSAEEVVEIPGIKVVEEPTNLNGEIKDFQEQSTQVVTAKLENAQVPPVQKAVIEPSPEPVKSSPEPRTVNPSIEQVSKEDPQKVGEDLEGPSSGGCIIAFFFPMIGFISALCNIGSNKKKAKRYALLAAGGLLVGFISGVIQAL